MLRLEPFNEIDMALTVTAGLPSECALGARASTNHPSKLTLNAPSRRVDRFGGDLSHSDFADHPKRAQPVVLRSISVRCFGEFFIPQTV